MRLWPRSSTGQLAASESAGSGGIKAALGRWLGGREAKSDTWSTFRDFFTAEGLVKSGATVNHRTALQVSTMLACARLIAEGVAQVPFQVYREADGVRKVASDRDIYWLLHKRPNDWQTSFEFREQITLHLVLCFNAYVFINRAGDGRVLELLPLEPGMVTVRQAADRVLSYTYTAGGEAMEIPAAQMWHIRGPSWNGWQGLDATRLAREALGLAMATEEHSARMFSNGAKLGGIVSTEATLNQQQLDTLRESWKAAQGGNSNAYKTAFLFGGVKWTPTGQQNDQAELTEQRRFQVEEVCRGARVMPIMVGAGDKSSTYASAEQMFIAHVTHTLMPWYRRIEDSADVNLLGLKAVREGYYTKFNANGLLRGSVQARGTFYTQLYNIGAVNPNEIRALEEMNPYDGGEKYRVPLNMVDPTDEPDPPAPGGADDPKQ